ncbi:MAG: toll/interleukin-1 receptor domain-containing protein, partial [Planctomycetaceae bacterium]|nr:toll/interleukin-1 receptor domain-containing protein [Planctomycetaceae bacterium]
MKKRRSQPNRRTKPAALSEPRESEPRRKDLARYRVFISYAHEDEAFCTEVIELLKKLSLVPLSDKRLAFGHGFLDQIQKYISYAHIFMPLVTKTSNQGQWVNQEIGFAAALGVPVFPLCLVEPPLGMIQTSHSLVLDSPGDLTNRLTRDAFDGMISWAGRTSRPLFECAEEVEERALMLADYSDQVRSISGPQKLRQAGGLTSFSIPNQAPGHENWKRRWGTGKRSAFSMKCLRKERQALEEHAREAGCRLIIHSGLAKEMDDRHGPGAWQARVDSLTEFLMTMPEERVELV